MPHQGYEQIVYNRLGESYPALIAKVMRFGVLVDSRAGKTREFTNLQLVLDEPEYCVVDRAGFSVDFMTEEILQLLAGVYDAERLRAAVPRAADMITDATAYGPRVTEQLLAVERELRLSPDSRRAVVYVGREDDLTSLLVVGEAAKRAGQMPCTLAWQFLIREGHLHMTVHMRSWDLVWGLSYDIPSFVSVQLALATALGLRVGRYVHTAGSAHIYEQHWDLDTQSLSESLLAHVGFVFGDSITATQKNALTAIGHQSVSGNFLSAAGPVVAGDFLGVPVVTDEQVPEGVAVLTSPIVTLPPADVDDDGQEWGPDEVPGQVGQGPPPSIESQLTAEDIAVTEADEEDESALLAALNASVAQLPEVTSEENPDAENIVPVSEA